MITFKRILKLAESLPGIEESTSYGTPALKVGKKLVLRMHDKEDAIVRLLIYSGSSGRKLTVAGDDSG